MWVGRHEQRLESCWAVGRLTCCLPIVVVPAGTGKTLIAKAIAGEARVPFYQMAGRCAAHAALRCVGLLCTVTSVTHHPIAAASCWRVG